MLVWSARGPDRSGVPPDGRHGPDIVGRNSGFKSVSRRARTGKATRWDDRTATPNGSHRSSPCAACQATRCPPAARWWRSGPATTARCGAAHWQPTARTCRGTVCILQGRAEFIEKYYETIGELRARGFCVVAFDWRGQGESDRRIDDPHKGHVARFDDYRRDLRAITESVLVPLMPEPHVGLAHSMGGCVALTCALDGFLPFARLVTVAPMLSIRMVAWPAGASALMRVLDRIGLGSRSIPFGKPVSIATKPMRATGSRAIPSATPAMPPRPRRSRRGGRRSDHRVDRRGLPGDRQAPRPARRAAHRPADADRGGWRGPGLRHARGGTLRGAAQGRAHPGAAGCAPRDSRRARRHPPGFLGRLRRLRTGAPRCPRTRRPRNTPLRCRWRDVRISARQVRIDVPRPDEPFERPCPGSIAAQWSASRSITA